MVIVSSISPLHSNNSQQIEALDSWAKWGKSFSLNTPSEIEQMILVYKDKVSFIKTEKTIKSIIGKPLVSINALIDFGYKCEHDTLLINSDIIIDALPELKQDGMTVFSRYDYTDHWGDAKIFNAGFDAFFIPKQFLNVFPPSIYGMGAAFWDYSLIYRFMRNKIPVYWPQGKHIYHKLHPTQYSIDEWLYIGEFFKLEFKLDKSLNIGQVATKIINEIKLRAIK